MYNYHWIDAPEILVSSLLKVTHSCNFNSLFVRYILGSPASNESLYKEDLKATLYCYNLHPRRSPNGELLIWEDLQYIWQTRAIVYTMGLVSSLSIFRKVAVALAHIPLDRVHEFVNNLGIVYSKAVTPDFLRFYLSNLNEFDDMYDNEVSKYDLQKVDGYI